MEEKNFLDEFAGQGYDNLSSDDYQLPFLQILQSSATQCVEKSNDYIEGAKPGMFYHNLTNQIFGKCVNVTPLYCEKVWLEFKPNRGGFVAKHEPNSFVPDKTDFSNWKNAAGNTIIEYYNFYCILTDFPENGIVVIPFKKSGIPQAKNWNSLISYVKAPSGKQAAFFSSIWTLTANYNENIKGSWYGVSSVTRVDYAGKELFYDYIKPSLSALESAKVDYKQLTSNIEEDDNIQF